MVQRHHLGPVGGAGQLGEVVHARVPGRVPARPGLQLGAEREREREVDLRVPQVLVGLLAGDVAAGGFGGQRGEPARRVIQRGSQGQPGPALGGLLGRGRRGLGVSQVGGGIGDVDDLDRRVEQLLETEGRVQRGVPGGDATGQHAAHGQRSGEPVRVTLDQACGDDAAQRVPPGDGPRRRGVGLVEDVERVDLVGQCLLNGPAGRGVGRAGQCVTVAEQPAAGDRIADVLGRVRRSGRHVAVAVEEERSVPMAGRALYEVGRAVRQRAARGGHHAGRATRRTGRRRCGRREPRRQQDPGKNDRSKPDRPHQTTLQCVRPPFSRCKRTIDLMWTKCDSLLVSGCQRPDLVRSPAFNSVG